MTLNWNKTGAAGTKSLKQQQGHIIVSPIGRIPDWICKTVAGSIQMIFGYEARIKSLLNEIDFAYDENRNQYHSTAVLERLADKAPENSTKILALTREDLFIPILTHVYGEAQLGGIACIVSISRLMTWPASGSMETGQQRIIKEAAHELGHTFDLRHCKDPMCIMHYCRVLEDVDLKSMNFCRYCGILLNDSIMALQQ